MSPHDEIAELEAELRANRVRLSGTVTDVATRLRPKNLANTAIDQIAGKAADVACQTLEVTKDNAGKATLFGAGALLAFDLGRVTARTSPEENSASTEKQSDTRSSFATAAGLAQGWATLPSLIGGLAATGLGYLLGKAIPVSRTEKDLLGAAPDELRSVLDHFWEDHKQGAKLAIADSFGMARVAAMGLSLMAAAASIMQSKSKTPL